MKLEDLRKYEPTLRRTQCCAYCGHGFKLTNSATVLCCRTRPRPQGKLHAVCGEGEKLLRSPGFVCDNWTNRTIETMPAAGRSGGDTK